MKKLLIFILFLSVSLLVAYQWPNEAGEIAFSFGSFRQGVVSKEITIAYDSAISIRPIEMGSLLFVQQANCDIMPVRAGSTVIMQNSNHIRSIYSYLDNVTVTSTLFENLPFATARNRDGYYTFNFALYDNQLNQFVNPLLFLPLMSQLNTAPVIHNISLLDPFGNLIPITSGLTLPSGHYELLAYATQASLLGPHNHRILPYNFTVEFMGNIITRLELSAFITASAGRALLHSSDIGSHNMYASNGMLRLASLNLTPGQFFITVRVANIFGVEIEQTVLITVVW